LAAIQKKEIELKKEPLDNPEVEKVLLTMGKQLGETVDQAKGAGRAEMAAAAEAEIVILKEFLPQQLSHAEVDAEVAAIVAELKSKGALPQGGAAMGAVMKAVMAKLGSKSDGKLIQAAVKKALG
jgi:uncharacterized protein YqeY